MSPHLLVDISAHGFGHLAQTAPVINALRDHQPALRITLRGGPPESVLRRRINGPLTIIPGALDPGMVMASSVDVLPKESLTCYRMFHRDWAQRVEAQAADIEKLAPDLLLANVPYLSLVGAKRAGVPAVAMCSLNWGGIFGHYCGSKDEQAEIQEQIRMAYAAAAAFLLPTPSMAMPELGNTRSIGPIAQTGRTQAKILRKTHGLADDVQLVLVALGGIDTHLSMENWPSREQLRWIAPRDWYRGRDDCLVMEELGLSFLDLLASCDAVVTKPGYGTFVEAACHGVRVIYADRPDWPEEPGMSQWLKRQVPAAGVPREKLWSGSFLTDLDELLAQPDPTPAIPTGVQQAVEHLLPYLEK